MITRKSKRMRVLPNARLKRGTATTQIHSKIQTSTSLCQGKLLRNLEGTPAGRQRNVTYLCMKST